MVKSAGHEGHHSLVDRIKACTVVNLQKSDVKKFEGIVVKVDAEQIDGEHKVVFGTGNEGKWGWVWVVIYID